MPAVLEIRVGRPADVEAVLALFDEAVAWLAARGRVGQWGPRPFSVQEQRVAQIAEWAASGGLRIAAGPDGAVLGALSLGARPAWVTPADRPERYIQGLVSWRAHAGEGVGAELIRSAVAETRAAGITLLRVDCWSGAPELVAWYESQGFRRSGTFEINGWHGQVLSLALD